MTAGEKEAIEELKILKEDYWEDDGYGYATAECQEAITAIDMAIEALEQQTCEDCISRPAVLDGLASIAKVKARSDAQKSLMGRIMFFVEQLPSVTPKEKTGKWIENAPEYQNIDPPYICSECGNMHLRKTNYCDQCGAKMVESQESEDKE